jgi:RNA recognition motif-containing protein
MAKNLFVGGISYNTTDETLANHFAQAGKVTSAKVIMDRFTGKSRGFAFVEFESDEEADNAIQTLDNSELDGRTIRVNEARPKA